MSEPETRVCGRCKIARLVTDFYSTKSRKSGRQWACRFCWHEYTGAARKRYEESRKVRFINKAMPGGKRKRYARSVKCNTFVRIDG